MPANAPVNDPVNLASPSKLPVNEPVCLPVCSPLNEPVRFPIPVKLPVNDPVALASPSKLPLNDPVAETPSILVIIALLAVRFVICVTSPFNTVILVPPIIKVSPIMYVFTPPFIVIPLSIFTMVSPVISPVNDPVYEPVFVANNSFDSFIQIDVPSTRTPIESPSINSKRSALKLVCPLSHEPDLFMLASGTG